ncbi:MAG: glutamine-hydrolyzing carbamoyl-phosphate synthase small subunit [Anaerolineae bacterium]
MSQAAALVLEDGTIWRGVALGARGVRTGEAVFNTAMTGYQEVLTDPSYSGQIVVMTGVHMGNTGLNGEDEESQHPWLAGFAVREASAWASSWRSRQSLDDYLGARNVVGIAGLDTRGLVRHIRTRGAMRAALANLDSDTAALLDLARSSPSMNGADLVRNVTCAAPYPWTMPVDDAWYSYRSDPTPAPHPPFHVVAYDFGAKYNILRLLVAHGCRVTVVPAATTAAQALALAPDGVFLSNGPGDPAAVTYAIASVRDLLGRIPIFGICLGHQILALALGGETYKLPFGHRGGNQPVKNLVTGQVEITTHNHGFAVRAESLPAGVQVTHLNLNDHCVEGLAAPARAAFSVQFHPEAAPGPHDALGLFNQFMTLMQGEPHAQAH